MRKFRKKSLYNRLDIMEKMYRNPNSFSMREVTSRTAVVFPAALKKLKVVKPVRRGMYTYISSKPTIEDVKTVMRLERTMTKEYKKNFYEKRSKLVEPTTNKNNRVRFEVDTQKGEVIIPIKTFLEMTQW